MLYIFLALVFYCTVIMVGAFAARFADSSIVAAIENIVSGILPIIIAIPLLNGKTLHDQKVGILTAFIVGILLAFFTIFMNKAYAANKVAIVAPIVFGGSIFITAILSYFLFKEKVSFIQGIGLALLAIGLIFIAYARFTGK
ncbi:MAG: EamA family transporter [Patescibacteria group bacterium]|nr:EamA family transporter [Patescibacteria group bacterium]